MKHISFTKYIERMENVIIDESKVFRDESYYAQSDFNKIKAIEMLKILKEVLQKKDVHFLLNFGTLLGAVRDHDFIPHDYDLDLSLHEKYKKAFIDSLSELEERGIVLCGHYKGNIFNLFYDGIICDIDIVFDMMFPYSLRYYRLLEKCYPKFYTDKTEFIDFLGGKYEVPKNPERFLEYMYGKNWRIPQKGKHARLFPHWMLLSRFHYYAKRFFRYHFK